MKRVTRTPFRAPMNNVVLGDAVSIRAFADARAGRRSYHPEGLLGWILYLLGKGAA